MTTDRPVSVRLLEGRLQLTARPTEDPLPRCSFGAAGAFAIVEGAQPRSDSGLALLTMRVPDKALESVDWTTLKVFRIEPEARAFDLIKRSGFDPKAPGMWAEIDRPGIYGAYGLPLDPAVRNAVRWLRDLHPLIRREGVGGSDRLRRTICDLILCANPFFVPPAGICERCLGLEIPELGMPEYRLVPIGPRAGVAGIWEPPTPCQLVNGPIAFVELATGEMQKLASPGANPQTCVTPAAASEVIHAPAWSPDGDRLAFCVTTFSGQARLETRDASCGDVRVVVTSPGRLGWCAWNPVRVGGQREVVFTRLRNVPFARDYELDAVNEDGTNQRTIIAANTSLGSLGTVRGVNAPAFSPDGKSLAFLVEVSGLQNSQLVVTNPDGSNAQPVGLNWDLLGPVFWTRDGRYVVTCAGAPLTAGVNMYSWLFFPMSNGAPAGSPVAWAPNNIQFLSPSPDGMRVCGQRVSAPAPRELFVADFDPITLNLSNFTTLAPSGYGPNWGPVCV